MSAPPSLHPSDRTLSDYGLGRLDGASAEAIDAHLETCEACRRRTSEMTSDSFLGRLQGARSSAGSLAGLGGPPASRSLTGAGAPVPAGSLPPELADHRDYKVVRELGRGGMGVVYLAENTLMGRMEVLKVIGRSMTDRPEVLDRFLREIRSVARLRHPNIVAAYHAFRVDGCLVFAMEHVDGFDLSRMVKARGPLPVAHACLFAQQTALGLQHAHEEGMVHRDIKPGNLMVARRGEKAVVKVLDFGLAKAASEGEFEGGLTHEGQMLGTPDYIAPEQIVDATKADIRADIYSLGCTLYYLLSGGPPFRGSSLYDLFQAHHSMDARPLNFARPEVPAELAAVVAKMMAKEPERRFRTPAEVSAALLRFTKKGSVTLKPAKADVPRVAIREVEPAKPVVGPTPARSTPSTASPGPRKAAGPEPPEARWSSLIDFRAPEPKAEAAEPVAETSPRPRWLWPAVAAGVLLAGVLAAWMGGVIKLRTPGGTIVLEGLPESAETFVDGEAVKLTTMPGATPFEFTVAPGTHKVRVRYGETSWESSDIAVVSGEKTPPIHVYLERAAPGDPGPGATAVDPPVPAVADRGPDPARLATISGGRWEVQGDELIQPDERSIFPIILFGDGRWTDYDFSADLMRTQGPSDASLVVRSTAIDQDLRFAVSGRGGWKYSFVEASEGQEKRVLKWADFPISSDKWYTALVRVRGGHVTSTLRDGDREVVRLDLDDDLHPDGRVGFRTWRSAWRFRNIRVTDPGGKVLWEGPPRIGTPGDGSVGGPVSVFNGKDLTDWEDLLPNGSEWKVVDGILEGRGSGKAGEPGVLVFRRDDLKDFRLRAKLRHRTGNLAWIELRRTSRDGFVNGYDVAVVHGPHAQGVPVGSIGLLKDYRYGGTRGKWSEATPDAVAADEWFDLTIDIHQNTIITSLNGKKVGEYTDPEGSNRSGAIALGCSWNTTVEYQSITLEEIPGRPPTPAPTATRADAQDWKPLFNGKDLDDFVIGWPEQHRWSVVDGTIVSDGPGSFTVLHTKRHYADFHLRLETMPPEGVAGAIDFRWEGPEATAGFYGACIAGTVDWQGVKTGNIQLWVEGKRSDVATASEPGVPLAPGRWFPMEIIAVGDTIRVRVRGEEVAHYKDPNRTHTSGPIGLFCRGKATMRFRNLQIRELSATPGTGSTSSS